VNRTKLILQKPLKQDQGAFDVRILLFSKGQFYSGKAKRLRERPLIANCSSHFLERVSFRVYK